MASGALRNTLPRSGQKTVLYFASAAGGRGIYGGMAGFCSVNASERKPAILGTTPTPTTI